MSSKVLENKHAIPLSDIAQSQVRLERYKEILNTVQQAMIADT